MTVQCLWLGVADLFVSPDWSQTETLFIPHEKNVRGVADLPHASRFVAKTKACSMPMNYYFILLQLPLTTAT